MGVGPSTYLPGGFFHLPICEKLRLHPLLSLTKKVNLIGVVRPFGRLTTLVLDL